MDGAASVAVKAAQAAAAAWRWSTEDPMNLCLPDEVHGAVHSWISAVKTTLAKSAATGKEEIVPDAMAFVQEGALFSGVLEDVCLQQCSQLLVHMIEHHHDFLQESVELWINLGIALQKASTQNARVTAAQTAKDYIADVSESRCSSRASVAFGDEHAQKAALVAEGGPDVSLLSKPLELTRKVVTVARSDLFAGLHLLFHEIGRSLSVLAVPLVRTLQELYSHPDRTVRDIAVSVSARLIYESRELFQTHENMAAVWNLFFLLDQEENGPHHWSRRVTPQQQPLPSSRPGTSLALVSPRVMKEVSPVARWVHTDGSRLAVIEALHVLVPVFTSSEPALTMLVVERLLALPSKTVREHRAVRHALEALFQEVHSDGRHTSSNDFLFGSFLSLLRASQEQCYDSLHWAVFQYTERVLAADRAERSRDLVQLALREFVTSLGNHLRAPMPLIRYGAALALDGVLKAQHGAVDIEGVFCMVTMCCIDEDTPTQQLGLKMLLRVCNAVGPTMADVSQQTSTIRQLFTCKTRPTSDASNFITTTVSAAITAAVTDQRLSKSLPLKSILGAVQWLLSGMEHTTLNVQCQRLHIVRAWLAALDQEKHALNANVILKILNLLGGSKPVLRNIVVECLVVLAPFMRHLPDPALKGLISSVNASLSAAAESADGHYVSSLLRVVPLLPFTTMTDANLQHLLSLLATFALHPSPAARRALYTTVASASAMWRTEALLQQAIGLLLLGITDANTDTTRAALSGASIIIPERMEALKSVLQAHSELLLDNALLPKIRIFDQVADLIWQQWRQTLAATLLAEPFSRLVKRASEKQLSPDAQHTIIHLEWWLLLYSKARAQKKEGTPDTQSNVHASIPFVRLLALKDPYRRNAASHAIKRACFLGGELISAVFDDVLRVCRDSLTGTQRTLQMATLELLRHLLVLGSSSVNAAITESVGALLVPLLEKEMQQSTTIALLHFLDAAIQNMPSLFVDRSERMRDRLREMLCQSSGPTLVQAIGAVYCSCAALATTDSSDAVASQWFAYFQGDIGPATGQKWERDADPLLSKLSRRQLNIVALTSLQACGRFRSPAIAESVLRVLVPFLSHADAQYRAVALESSFSQLRLAKPGALSTVLQWVLLPLKADADANVREEYRKHCATNYELKDISGAKLSASVAQALAKDDREISYDLIEHRLKSRPMMTANLVQMLQKEIASWSNQVLNPDTCQEILFHLNRQLHVADLSGPAAIVMSELYKRSDHTTALNGVRALLLQTDQELHGPQRQLVLGAVLGVQNIAATEPETVQISLQHATSASVIKQGNVRMLHATCHTIAEQGEKRPDDLVPKQQLGQLADRLLHFIQANKASAKTATLALDVVRMLSEAVPAEVVERLVTELHGELQHTTNPTFHVECARRLHRIVAAIPATHTVVQQLKGSIDGDVSSPEVSNRMRALTTVAILDKHVSRQERIQTVLTLLADPSRPVREHALRSMMQRGEEERVPSFDDLRNVVQPVVSRAADAIPMFGRSQQLETLSDAELLSLEAEVMNCEGTDDVGCKHELPVRLSDASSAAVRAHQASQLPDHPLEQSIHFDDDEPEGQIVHYDAALLSGHAKVQPRTVKAMPLHDEDRFNLEYLHSRRYRSMLQIYTLENRLRREQKSESVIKGNDNGTFEDSLLDEDFEDAFAELTAVSQYSKGQTNSRDESKTSSEGTAASGKNESGSGMSKGHRDSLICSIQAHAISTSSVDVVINALLKEDETGGAAILDKLLGELDHAVKTVVDKRSMNQKLHALGVFLSLLRSKHPNDKPLLDKFKYISNVQRTGRGFKLASDSLRNAVMGYVHELAFAQAKIMDIPVASPADYLKLLSYSDAMRDTALDGVKRRKLMESQRTLQAQIAKESETLHCMCHMQKELVDKVKIFFMSDSGLKDAEINQAITWFSTILYDDHRAVRKSARDALVNSCVQNISRPVVSAHICQLVQHLVDMLQKPQSQQRLRRLRVDIIAALVAVAPSLDNAHPIHAQLVPLLISAWDDVDSAVRALAFDAIVRLGLRKYRPLLSFANPAPNSQPVAVSPLRPSQPSPLILAINQRMNENYRSERERTLMARVVEWYMSEPTK